MDEPLSLLPEGTFAAQFGVDSYTNAFVPSGLNTGAESFLDVLKYGVGRIADYKIATVTPQNTGAQMAPARGVAFANTSTAATAAAAGSQLAGMLPMLAVVGLVLLIATRR